VNIPNEMLHYEGIYDTADDGDEKNQKLSDENPAEAQKQYVLVQE
jgi:hypothetical protein